MPETHPDSRFAADVVYSGRAGTHDYVVDVRHRFLGTTFTVTIDGIEHDPVAEEKAREAEDRAAADGADDAASEDTGDPEADGVDTAGSDGAEDAATAGADDAGDAGTTRAEGTDPDGDDLRFSLEDGFTTVRCTVRRPREKGGYKDAEVLTIRTAGLGGAGEVEIRHGFRTTVLIPSDGSPSAVRDAKRTAHPTRYALIAAATKSARYLLPLLGIGALLSGLLDPVEEWIEERIRPVVEAVAEATAPVREWIAQLLQPVRDVLAALWQPVADVIAAVLRPVRDLLAWLLGLLPDIDLPFDVPDWLFEVLIAVIVVAAVFSATRRGLRERRTKLEESRQGKSGAAGDGEQVDEDSQEEPADEGGAGPRGSEGHDDEGKRVPETAAES